MLSKCANPGCGAPFRYLNEGKVYVADYFDEGDVVRHHLVQRIVRAYEDYKGRNEQLSLSLDLRSGGGFATPRAASGEGNTPTADREAQLAEVPPVPGAETGNRISE